MFIYAQTGTYYYDWCNATYYNLWSADNTTTGWNDNAVVKTVYDPSPVGFKMPASNAFTGFTSNGKFQTTAANINVDGTTDSQKFSAAYGHNFYTNSSKNKTIFFPASGIRRQNDGSLFNVGNSGYYWSAVPSNASSGCYLGFSWSYVNPQDYSNRSYGFAARPVSAFTAQWGSMCFYNLYLWTTQYCYTTYLMLTMMHVEIREIQRVSLLLK